MPHLRNKIGVNGPIVRAVFYVSTPRIDALRAAGQNAPRPFVGMALIDTGASHTCVDPVVTQELNLEVRGQDEVVTPSTGHETHRTAQFDIAVIIPPRNPGDEPLIVPVLPVDHATLFARQGIHALIGRDILQNCTLSYYGRREFFRLQWQPNQWPV